MYSSACVGSSLRYLRYTLAAVSVGIPPCIKNFCRHTEDLSQACLLDGREVGDALHRHYADDRHMQKRITHSFSARWRSLLSDLVAYIAASDSSNKQSKGSYHALALQKPIMRPIQCSLPYAPSALLCQ